MKFTLNRDYVLVTPEGPSYGFANGEPVHVQPRHAALAMSIGAVAVEGDAPAAKAAVAQVELEAAELAARPGKVLAAVKEVLAENDAADFTGAGRPHLKKLSARVGFEVKQVELDKALEHLKSE